MLEFVSEKLVDLKARKSPHKHFVEDGFLVGIREDVKASKPNQTLSSYVFFLDGCVRNANCFQRPLGVMGLVITV